MPSVKTREGDLVFNEKQEWTSGSTKKPRKYDLIKGLQKLPASDPKEIENCTLFNKDFKTMVLRKLSEPQENKQLNKIRKQNTNKMSLAELEFILKIHAHYGAELKIQ